MAPVAPANCGQEKELEPFENRFPIENRSNWRFSAPTTNFQKIKFCPKTNSTPKLLGYHTDHLVKDTLSEMNKKSRFCKKIVAALLLSSGGLVG